MAVTFYYNICVYKNMLLIFRNYVSLPISMRVWKNPTYLYHFSLVGDVLNCKKLRDSPKDIFLNITLH